RAWFLLATGPYRGLGAGVHARPCSCADCAAGYRSSQEHRSRAPISSSRTLPPGPRGDPLPDFPVLSHSVPGQRGDGQFSEQPMGGRHTRALVIRVARAAVAGAKPASYKLPPETSTLKKTDEPGYAKADSLCASCHSRDYITTQARGKGKDFWTAE